MADTTSVARALPAIPRQIKRKDPRRFYGNDGDDAEMSERQRVSEMRKFWNKAKAAYQDGKTFFSKKVSGTLAGERDIIEDCRNDPKALNAAKQLASFFNQVVEKAEKR